MSYSDNGIVKPKSTIYDLLMIYIRGVSNHLVAWGVLWLNVLFMCLVSPFWCMYFAHALSLCCFCWWSCFVGLLSLVLWSLFLAHLVL
jgi:hypothetical protein